MADRVARSPARLCSRDGKLCYYYRRLEYDLFFSLSCFYAFCFLIFLFFSVLMPACFSSSCCFVPAAPTGTGARRCSCLVADGYTSELIVGWCTEMYKAHTAEVIVHGCCSGSVYLGLRGRLERYNLDQMSSLQPG